MIKDIWDIKLIDYDIIERYGVVKHLRKAYNILPVIFFYRTIRKRTNEIVSFFESKDHTYLDIRNEKDKIEDAIIIKALSMNYDGPTLRALLRYSKF